VVTDTFTESAEVDRGKGFEQLSRHWFELMRIAPPGDTELLRQYLTGLVQPILALDDVHIKSVRFLISDDKEPNAAVIKDDADDAVVFVTRGLLDYVDTEDELFGVLAHELGHVEIRARIGSGNNSRPEEIGADGFAAQWMVQTGRNWRALQRFFKKLAGHEKEHEDKISGAEKVKHQIMDVHSTAIDRVQHVQTAVGIMAIKEQREISEPAEKPLPDSIKQQGQAVKHQSYMDLVLERNGFEALSPTARLEMLAGLDPRHYRRKFIPPETWDSKDKKKEVMLESEARLLRAGDFRDASLKALKALAKEKDDAGITAYSPAEQTLLNEIVDVAGLYSDIAPRTGNGFLDFDPRVYVQVNRMLHGQQTRLEPLGQNLTRLNSYMRDFVNAKSYEQAVAAAQALKMEIEKHTVLGYHTSSFEYSTLEEAKIDVVLYKSLNLPHFQATDSQALPWAQHVTWAGQDKSGVLAEMLWRIGVNTDRALWQAVPPDQLEDRKDQWNFTQAPGDLATYSFTDPSLLVAIDKNEQWDYLRPKKIDKNTTQFAQNIVVNIKKQEEFSAFADDKVRKFRAGITFDTPEFQPGTLKKTLPEFVSKNEALLTAPYKASEHGESFPEPDPDQDINIHYKRARALLDGVAKCLEAGNADDREAARALFLDNHRYSNQAVPCLSWLTRAYKQIYPWQSPFIRFVEVDRFNLFTQQEKSGILLQASRYTGGNGSSQKDKKEADLPFWRSQFGYKKPENFSDLVAMARHIDILADPCKQAKAEKRHINERDEGIINRTLAKDFLFNTELDHFLETNKPSLLTHDFVKLAGFYLDNVKASLMSGFLNNDTRQKLQSLFAAKSDDLKTVQFVPGTANLTLEEMIDVYQFLDHEALFPNLTFKLDFGKKILTDIEAAPDVNQRIALLERLAFTSKRKMERPLSDFVLMEAAIQKWAGDIAKLRGLDDGSDDCHKNIMAPLLDQIEQGMPERDRLQAFRALADAVVAQKSVCRDIEKRLQIDRKTFDIADAPIRGVETMMNYMRKSMQNRKDALDFFMQTENDQSISDLCDKFIAYLNESPVWRKAPFVHELGLVSLAALNVSDEEALKILQDPELDKKLKNRVEEMARQVHRFFWSRNLDIRTVFVNYLLITSEDLVKDPDAAYKGALDLTLDRLFAKEPDNPDEKLRNQWAREFLEVYLANAHESERSLIMAALVSSAQSDNITGNAQSFGERLANILGMLGPAYYKLGQAIHSHPHTPEDIRGPMAKLKSMGEKPFRWHYINRIDKAVPEQMRGQFSWIGDIVGKASFFTTGPVKMMDGSELMLGLLGENATAEAEHGFNRIEACARTLEKRNPEFSSMSRVIIGMIRQARDLVKVETDLHLGAKQAQYMQEQYGGLVVEADGQQFHYDPKAWRYYGDTFKLMDIAEGQHFDELPENTPEQAAYKRRWPRQIQRWNLCRYWEAAVSITTATNGR
jgi:hypothetical protein